MVVLDNPGFANQGALSGKLAFGGGGTSLL
jgi:hypothetical protein